jgi:hypothetical protein
VLHLKADDLVGAVAETGAKLSFVSHTAPATDQTAPIPETTPNRVMLSDACAAV